jgi:hypothetical protein
MPEDVFERPRSKFWQLRWTTPDGVEIRRSSRTQVHEEARAQLDRIKAGFRSLSAPRSCGPGCARSGMELIHTRASAEQCRYNMSEDPILRAFTAIGDRVDGRMGAMEAGQRQISESVSGLETRLSEHIDNVHTEVTSFRTDMSARIDRLQDSPTDVREDIRVNSKTRRRS